MAILIAMPRQRSAELAATLLSEGGDKYRSRSYRRQIDNPDLSGPFDNLRFGAGTRDLTESEVGNIGGTGPSLSVVGAVIRTVPHSNGQAPAGYTATFYAVRASK